MKYYVLFIVYFFISCSYLAGQSKTDLEEQRRKTLDEINYVDNILRTTSKEKTESLNSLKMIGSKLTLRERVISGMREEVDLLQKRISLNSMAIEMMEKDLLELRRDYSNAIVNSYKSHKINGELIYILSARDFNQGYKRVKYLQQAAKFRRNETEVLAEIKNQIESTKIRLEKDLFKISDLKSREEQQKVLLQQEQKRRQNMVRSLGNKEKQLKKELEDKRKIARRIENEIARLIEEERRKNLKSDMTPDQRLIGDNFSDNKGLLPWPVEEGIITGHFGVQSHPVLKYVTENNIGIEITSSGTTAVRSIFKGEIMRVFPIPGENMAIIVRHGKYLSVYQNIVDVKVKKGDKVDVRQELGKVFCETENSNKAIMKLMIFEEMEKLDPELWISKRK